MKGVIFYNADLSVRFARVNFSEADLEGLMAKYIANRIANGIGLYLIRPASL